MGYWSGGWGSGSLPHRPRETWWAGWMDDIYLFPELTLCLRDFYFFEYEEISAPPGREFIRWYHIETISFWKERIRENLLWPLLTFGVAGPWELHLLFIYFCEEYRVDWRRMRDFLELFSVVEEV